MNLLENYVENTALWINVRKKEVLDLNDGDIPHHNEYLLENYDTFGYSYEDIEPYLGLDYEDMISSVEMREKALRNKWCRVTVGENTGMYYVSIEALNMRCMHQAACMLMDRGVVFKADRVTVFYDLVEPARSGRLTGDRAEEFIASKRF